MKNIIIIIIPAYNEEWSIGKIVKGALRVNGVTQCVVVDDGSSDNTAAVAKRAGARVFHRAINGGTGVAVRDGLYYAIRRRADIVVLMDADGQHDPKDIPKLLKRLKTSDVVVGSRYITHTTECTPLLRRVGTHIISFFISVLYQQEVRDSTSGFRAMDKRAAIYLSKNYPVVFPEPETTLMLLANKYVLREVSITMKRRLFGQSSISLPKAFFLMVYISIRILVCSINKASA